MLLPIVEWWMQNQPQAFSDTIPPVAINRSLNGQVPEIRESLSIAFPPSDSDPMSPDIREKYQKTFIWGGIGEKAYVRHIGDKIEDRAEERYRSGRPITEIV